MRAALLFALVLAAGLAPSVAAAPEVRAPWVPHFWLPSPDGRAMMLRIIDAQEMARRVRERGFPAGTPAYADWSREVCEIYVTPQALRVIPHEIRHCQEGHFHD